MATKMLSKNTIRYVVYAPSMRSVANKLQSPNNRSMTTMTMKNNNVDTSMSAQPHWPQHDPHFPLPGNVAVDMKNLDEVGEKHNYRSLASALLHLENDTLRKRNVVNQYVFTDEINATTDDVASTDNKVECTIQICPSNLKKGFQELFSGIPDTNVDLTVITLSQETVNDMTTWSEEVDEEREILMGLFVENAKDVCQKIINGGYWADFIDPGSGQAFYSEHRNGTLFETDDRFNQLGFHVEDLGCCKVLTHKKWKSNVFVGIIFTNAPIESDIFATL